MQNCLKITKILLKVRENKLAQQGSAAKPSLFDANESINCLATPMTPTWPPQIMQQVCLSIQLGPQRNIERRQLDYSALITDICKQSVACPTCEITHTHVCVASPIKLNSKRIQLFGIWINTRMRRRHLKFASLRCVQQQQQQQVAAASRVKSQQVASPQQVELWEPMADPKVLAALSASSSSSTNNAPWILHSYKLSGRHMCVCSMKSERQLGGRTEAPRRQLST